jgi:transposase
MEENMTTQTPTAQGTARATCLYMAMELSAKQWKLGFTDGSCRRARHRTVPAGALGQVAAEASAAKQKLGLPEDAPVRSMYEAGRDGFWIHRALERCGYENIVIDPSSLEVDRRARRAKTDRLDLEKLLASLVRHHRGEKVWRTVRVPTEQDEVARRRHRERERLLREASALNNCIRSLLVTHGIQIRSCHRLASKLESLRRWDGSVLPAEVVTELKRMSTRWELVQAQLRDLESEIRAELGDDSKASEQARTLQLLRGISAESALVLSKELFAWREIRNRRQLGALAGMVGSPYSSGDVERDRGISKAGNRRVRVLMTELAWCWLRYQPTSGLSKWFHERFGGGKRMKRIGIIAVARKLLIAFWRFVEDGVVPDGARLKPAIA